MGGTYVVLVHKNGSIVFVASRLLLKIVGTVDTHRRPNDLKWDDGMGLGGEGWLP